MVSFRERVRLRLREEVLNAAYKVATTEGWDRLRVADLAYELEVSRQTIYKEFGTKEGIGEALVLREADAFAAAAAEQFARHPANLGAGLLAAIELVLERAAESALVRAIMLSARAKGPNSLLPLLTTRATPLLAAAGAVVADYVCTAEPGLDPEDVAVVADTLIRLVLSHLMLPAGTPREDAGRLSEVAVRALGVVAPRAATAPSPPAGVSILEARRPTSAS